MAAVAPAPPATPPRSASGSLRTTPAFSPRSPAAASDGSSSRPSSAIIYGVQGAEGGVEAITARRRNSGSFKHMATGGLVSKSPFTQHKSGSSPASPTKTASSPASSIPVANGLYRRTSGSSRRMSGEIDGAVKENSWPSDLSEAANGPALPAGSFKSPNSKTRAFFSNSPFEPVPSSGSQSTGTTTLSTRSTPSSSPFKPARPTSTHIRQDSHNGSEEPRRQTSSFAALRKNNLVSSSPFIADKDQQASAPSPDLPQVPYEIGALTHESAPMDFHRPEFDDAPASTTAQHLANARARAAQVEAHGWNGPAPQAGSASPTRACSSSADSVKSALTSSRRGMRGPRPLDGTASSSPDDGDETEREDLSPRVIRRQPSSKSVAWAETEEVFEFEVESERRHSLMSETSTDDGRYYNSSSDDDEIASHHAESEHSGAEEEHEGSGFSWSLQQINAARPIHAAEQDDDHNSDAEESVISTASSAMDEIVGQIDEYLHEESLDDSHVFSPSQIPSSFDEQPDIPSHHDTSGYSSPQIPQGPSSAFSVSSVSAADDTASEVLSTSSYGNESEEEAQVTIAQKAVFSVSSAPPIALPPLPQRTELPSRPTDELPAVTARPAVSALAQSDSQFSLPDIPGTSPFLGFEDDGKADSVVTLGPDTRPLSLPSTRPLQPHSPAAFASRVDSGGQQQQQQQPTPSRFVPSPIMASVHRMAERGLASPINLDASPALSRKASLVGSDVTTSSISWYGSTASGSLRGGTVRLGRDRLEERMKAHQALFGPGPDSPAASFGAFPTPSSPAGSSSTEASRSTAPTSIGDHAEHGSKAVMNRAIEARPAPKARSATLSSTMLPTIAASPQRAQMDVSIGSPLTSRVAEEMQSPLERLQRGMQDREGEHEWRSGDSLLGHANASADISGDDLAPLTTAFDRIRGPTRRRSRSTGDADLAETSSILTLEVQPTMPELGFEASTTDEGFGSSVLQSLDDIYNSRNRSYRVRESKQVVVVSDINGSRAGDVDPGTAWRRKRPSDVHAVNRSLSTMSIAAPAARKAKEVSGQLFLLLREVNFEGMPLPRQPVRLTAVLDNGRQRVDVAVRDLDAKVALKKEFELICSADLVFAIHFTVPRPSAASTPVLPQSPPAVSTPPSSPTKAQRALRLFSSPKKKATPTKSASPAPPPTPDPFWDYVSIDGELATSRVAFATEANNCRLKKSRLLVPFGAKDSSSPRSCSGSLVIDMLFVPAVTGVPKAQLPKSMDEVLAGLEVVDTATTVAFESPLTQLGGDTTVWRRRVVKLRGGMLVPYSEVTKRSHVEIDLSLVSHVADLNAASPAGKTSFDDDEEDLACMDNSFRLVFKDGNRIDFYADSPRDKTQWLEVLGKTIAAEGGVRVAPAWSIAVRKLPAPKA